LERDPTTGDDLILRLSGPRIFKGITSYHYTMMTDLLNGAAGAPLKWNDAKEFGEMAARSAAPSSFEQYNAHFDGANYKANYMIALDAHRNIVSALIVAGIAPWSVTDRGVIEDVGGVAGLAAKNETVGVCWLYKTQENANGSRDLSAFAPQGSSFSLEWINPWNGSSLLNETVSLTELAAIDIRTGKMDSVAPTGFEERSAEDVLVLIKKR